MAEGSHQSKIKPEDLRSECQACGGYGRPRVPRAKLLFEMPAHAPNYSGPCGRCAGSGKTYPRKAYK